MRIRRYEIVWDGNALDDFDALARQRIVLHVAHRNEAVDTFQAEPVDHIRHKLLELRILHAGDALGALEILCRRVATFLALARVVDQELGHFTECAAFLAVIDDDAESPRLSGVRALLSSREAGRDGRCRYRSQTRRSRCIRRAHGR